MLGHCLGLSSPDCKLLWNAPALFMHSALSLFSCMSRKIFRCFLSIGCWFFSLHRSLLLILWVALMDSAACSPSWRTLSDDMPWGRRSTENPEALEVSENNKKNREAKHQGFSLTQNKLLIRAPLFCCTLPITSENDLSDSGSQPMIHLYLKLLFRSDLGKQKRGNAERQVDICLEELLRLPAALTQFDKWPRAGLALPLPLSSTCGIIAASHLGADGQWQCIDGLCAVHDPFCIWRRSLAKRRLLSK